MTRVIFVDEDVVVMLEADLPAAELLAALQSRNWSPPPALAALYGAQQPPLLRALRLGALVVISPAVPRSTTGPLALDALGGLEGKPAGALSPRQAQVLQGLADGLTTRQIAGQLGLHVRTVELHIANIKRRFGTSSRMQSVLRGLAMGLCKTRNEPK